MGKYKKPKQHLHRNFVYLQHDTVLNSLSSFEAGKVDEIIEKTSEATDRGLEAGVGKGPVKVGGSRKRQAQVQEELIRRRTNFSAFESWYQAMRAQDALGEFEEWDLEVRNALEVGDTIQFSAYVELSPLHLMMATFSSFAEGLNKPGSVFQANSKEAADARKTAAMMQSWVVGRAGGRSTAVYFLPEGVPAPRIVGRVEDQYILGGLDTLQGRFIIVGQVDSLLSHSDKMSVIRVIRDVPPTPKEIEVAGEALAHFKDATPELGIELKDDDITLSYPTVVLTPIAIYR